MLVQKRAAITPGLCVGDVVVALVAGMVGCIVIASFTLLHVLTGGCKDTNNHGPPQMGCEAALFFPGFLIL